MHSAYNRKQMKKLKTKEKPRGAFLFKSLQKQSGKSISSKTMGHRDTNQSFFSCIDTPIVILVFIPGRAHFHKEEHFHTASSTSSIYGINGEEKIRNTK